MIRFAYFLVVIILVFLFIPAKGQYLDIDDLSDKESVLYAQTKQVNQFFRRFNNQEDLYGKREDGDEYTRNNERRKEYLNILFDKESNINDDLKAWFIRDVTSEGNPEYINFHEGGWFAEVSTTLSFNGQEENGVLYLKLEKENLGYKWVLINAHFYPFSRMFFNKEDTVGKKTFLHPMSHEIDFMNLNKTFKQKDYLEYYTEKSYAPDYLTLLLYEIKKGNIRFITINNVKFHFLQVKNWYFELSYFNREGYNSGWLISNLLRIDESEKPDLLELIYHETK
jgi:hypothetical protein